jgi:REP element-mobilizing transposase RayT
MGMARHLRLEYEGAIYHVTSRGNERSDIFAGDEDKRRFVEKLAENVARHQVRVYAYVVMRNHYHLLLETPRANLAAFMQQLNTSYTMRYNVRHARVGHVFSGRYKAKLVAGDEYLLALTRYVHLNPVQIEEMRGRPLAERITALREYRWSSYGGYAGLRKPEGWVDAGPLSGLAGPYAGERREGYRVFVESGLTEADEELREALQRSSKAVGGWGFCRQVERDYRQRRRQTGSGVDVAMRRVEAGVDPAEVKAQVARALKLSPEALFRRRSLADGRLVTALLLKELTGLTQREIGRHVGLGDGSGLGRLLKVAERELASRWSLRRRYAALRKALCA